MAQVGVDPLGGAVPGTPDELRNRPPREQRSAIKSIEKNKPSARLEPCLRQAANDPKAALETARDWRRIARSTERAQAAECQGMALVGLERFGEAQDVFASARAEAPEGSIDRARLGAMAANAALAGGDAKAALAQAGTALADAKAADDNPMAASIELDRARALVSLKETEQAAAALTSARTLDPKNGEAWLLSATLSRRMNNLAQAQTQIEQAAILSPRDPSVGLEAGVIAALAGRDENARKSFRSVITLAPDSEQAKQAQGYLDQLKP
ncbi:MAG: tetratricopeptide repeat protein [Sphingomonadaceae bacterium]